MTASVASFNRKWNFLKPKWTPKFFVTYFSPTETVYLKRFIFGKLQKEIWKSNLKRQQLPKNVLGSKGENMLTYLRVIVKSRSELGLIPVCSSFRLVCCFTSIPIICSETVPCFLVALSWVVRLGSRTDLIWNYSVLRFLAERVSFLLLFGMIVTSSD